MTSDDGLDTFVGGLDYPMYVVTTRVGDDRAGCLVGFTTQTSIDPQRFLVNVAAQVIDETFLFAVAACALGLAIALMLRPSARPEPMADYRPPTTEHPPTTTAEQ